MQVSYRTNHVKLGDAFKEHVDSKLRKIETYADRIQRVEIRASVQGHGSSSQVNIELTVDGKGPVIRAEAAAGEKESAFDRAYDKLLKRLRRARDRRKNHYGRRDAISVAKADVGLESAAIEEPLYVQYQQEQLVDGEKRHTDESGERECGEAKYAPDDVPVYIRQKRFKPEIISVDEAIDRMELLGHAFFLFIDEETQEPSVVYRRHGWTYGEIALSETATLDVNGTERYLKYRQ